MDLIDFDYCYWFNYCAQLFVCVDIILSLCESEWVSRCMSEWGGGGGGVGVVGWGWV